MNPLWTAALRRHWPLVGAVGMLLLFLLVHGLWVGPTLARYRAVVRQARNLGLALDPAQLPPSLPPRLFALLSANSMPARTVVERGDSGVLTAQLVEDVTRLAARHGMTVLITEPGPVTQQDGGAHVTAHLRLRARYGEFVSFLDELAHGGRLIAVDRFAMAPQAGADDVLELWVSQYVVKESGARP